MLLYLKNVGLCRCGDGFLEMQVDFELVIFQCSPVLPSFTNTENGRYPEPPRSHTGLTLSGLAPCSQKQPGYLLVGLLTQKKKPQRQQE